MRSFVWGMAFIEQQINLGNLTLHVGQISTAQNVGEIEHQFLLLGAQRLVKLTPGIDFINIFTRSFYTYKSPQPKNSIKLSVSFYAFGIYVRKSCT